MGKNTTLKSKIWNLGLKTIWHIMTTVPVLFLTSPSTPQDSTHLELLSWTALSHIISNRLQNPNCL